MSYLGNQPNSAAFLTDQFSGNGSTTAWTLSTAPAGTTSILVSVSGILQDPSTYSVVGTTLTLGGAAPTGTGNISVRYLGIPAAGVVTTAYRTVTEFTATAGQTTFTPPSYSVGFIAVYLNGARLGAADFTASNGTTIILATGASVDDLVVTESFYISSVANAIPNIPGSVTSTNIGYTPVNKAGDTISGYLEVGNTVRVTSISNPSGGAGMELAYDGTQGVIQVYSNRSALTAVPVLLGSGQLKFPPSQIASADANVLDDYEEGTFSLSYAGGGSSPTITSQSCSYVKIGRSVTVSISIQINLGSTSTTLGTLSGFPFVFATNYATAIAREWYSTGKAIEVVGNIGGTSAPLIFYDNSVSLTGVTYLGVGTTFSYVTT